MVSSVPPAVVQQQTGGEQRQRNRDAADEGRSPVGQKQEQHQYHQQTADEQRHTEILQRHLDERRRPEDRGIDRDVLEARRQLRQHRLDVARHLQGICAQLFLDDEEQPRTVIDDGVSDRRRRAFDNGGHVADAQRGSVARRDDDRFEVAHRLHRRRVRHGETLVRRVDKTAGLQRHTITGSAQHVIHCQAVRAETIGVHQDLELPIALAPDRHVGHTAYRHQTRANRPLGQRCQLDLGKAIGRQADLQDAAQ